MPALPRSNYSMSRESTIAIAKAHLDRGDALGWFEEVYRAHSADAREIPWADFAPNDLLVSWLDEHGAGGLAAGTKACVVGCGLGDDAAELARRGARVTAFDLSPTAIDLARQRFPALATEWHAADLYSLPAPWRRSFDVVFEAYTLQSLPADLRRQAFENIAALVAPGGKLVIVARLREPADAVPAAPPWPLTRAELIDAPPAGLTVEREEEYPPSDKHPARRIRLTYRREP